MSNDNYQIFISYRRNGSDAHARVFYDRLKDKGFSVFLDFESLFSGGFEGNILKAIDGCTDFILLLPKNGLDRCSDEDDLMRKEIREALNNNKNIIPVFINGFTMPDKKDLPDDIAMLVYANGIECSMEYFNAVFDKVYRNLDSQPRDNKLYESLQRLHSRVLSLNHDYFKKWACIKINSFLNENDDFFDGTNHTDPHAEDTFGIAGIQFTEKNIKAITVVADYWQDPFTLGYLEKQAELIKKGISITRVFVLEKNQYDAAKGLMQYQSERGIDVYYIYKGNEFIDPAWLEEDYLIQDERLLVEINCKSHRFDSTCSDTETITTSTVEVQIKLERYQRIIERAKKFTSER